MPLRELLKDGALRSSDVYRLQLAYSKAIRALQLADPDDPITSIVAQRILKVGTSGTSDPQEIADVVIQGLRNG